MGIRRRGIGTIVVARLSRKGDRGFVFHGATIRRGPRLLRGLAAGRGLVLWVKVKCLHREEFVMVGWTDPEGTRPWLGALPLAYYEPGGRLVYAGRAGTGLSTAELERLWRRLQPLAVSKMPLEVPPPRTS